MTTPDQDALVSRARLAIHAAHGTSEDEFGATLFVTHHLEELGAEYWEASFGNVAPEPSRIIDGLIVADVRSSADGHAVDFTLPGSVTDAVVCVRLNADGGTSSVSMES